MMVHKDGYYGTTSPKKVICCWYSTINGNKVSLKSECYEEYILGYPRLDHVDICTFALVFYHGNKSRAEQGSRG